MGISGAQAKEDERDSVELEINQNFEIKRAKSASKKYQRFLIIMENCWKNLVCQPRLLKAIQQDHSKLLASNNFNYYWFNYIKAKTEGKNIFNQTGDHICSWTMRKREKNSER